ncbi:sucrase ferredoxin [Pedococcus sp. 2YAF34]|uniref:sucrase ferredoxin n=1 Tax=Pedococcus sp. 2YAF34 TaxID=3233032 RepID=UPI003F9DDFD7
MTGHAVPAPDACSVGFDRAGLRAYGTAARASFFLAVEQPGPWGRDAATESHLPPGLGRALAEACSTRGGRLSLIRRPGRHADDHHEPGQVVYLAWAGPDPWLLTGRVTDHEVLLDVDLDALARGDADAVRASLPALSPSDPVLLVCTNGRRDVCCAVRGRPVTLDAAAVSPGRVWEASHTGGHRFAPTGVLLPHGATLARLDTELSTEVLAAAGRGELPQRALGPLHDRGRSPLDGAEQAAESHVRHLVGETSLTALTTSAPATAAPAPDSGAVAVVVSHRDGREWLVACERRTGPTELPESCGKTPIPVATWETAIRT